MHKSSSFNEKKKKKLTNNNTGDGEFQLQNQDTIVNKPSYGLSSLHHFFFHKELEKVAPWWFRLKCFENLYDTPRKRCSTLSLHSPR